MVVDSVAGLLRLAYLHRLDNEFMRDHPGENFIPGRNANIDFMAMKYRAAECDAILLTRAIFILFAIIPRTFHLNFLSAVLIVFIDHVRCETKFFESISRPNFYDSTLAINSYIYELIGELVIIYHMSYHRFQ